MDPGVSPSSPFTKLSRVKSTILVHLQRRDPQHAMTMW